MNRPLVAVVSCYAAGLLLAEISQPPLAALFAASFFVLVLALVLEKFRPILICILLALAGWTNLVFHTAVISPDDLRNLIGGETNIVSVRGILIETPKLKISERDDRQTEHSLAQVRTAEVRRDKSWRPVLGTIIVTTPSALPEKFFAGQSVEISGVIATTAAIGGRPFRRPRLFADTRHLLPAQN